MKKICGIYKIMSPKGRVYIGQSVNIKKRFNSYRTLHCEGQRRLFNSLKKHGVEKHKFEILCECDIKELDEMECYYIDLYQSFGSENGLNLYGGGNKNRVPSEETRRLSGASNGGKIVSQRVRDLLRKAMLGKKHTPETIKKMSAKQKGKIVSNETREKLRAANVGRVQKNKGHKLNNEKATKIRALCQTKNYKQIDLAKMFNVSRPLISNICRKKSIIWKNGI